MILFTITALRTQPRPKQWLEIHLEIPQTPSLKQDQIRIWASPAKSGKAHLKTDTGDVIMDPSEICERLNLYYGSVLKRSEKCDIDWDSKQGIINDLEITEKLVEDAIKNAKMSNSKGPDGISNRMLKLAPKTIITPITLLLREVLKQSKIPDIWKVSLIRPIAKSGSDCAYPKNTRPIACESNLAKILEKIVADHIQTKLEETSFFDPKQYGFRKSRSTEKCINDMFNRLFCDLLDGWSIIIVTIDYRKCFDIILHHILLRACFDAGICGAVGKYLQNWTELRTQFVEFENRQSAHISVTSSTVQGSMLGPLLFLVLNNSSQSVFKHSHVYSYCDDQNIYYAYKSVEELELFKSDLDRYTEWLRLIGHEVNLSKCFVLPFGPLRPDLSGLKINGESLQETNETKFLGVWINSDQGFKSQREKQLNKIKRAVASTKIMLRHAPYNIKLQCYNLYVRPLTNYAAESWWNWKTLDDLNEQYRNYFSGCKPASSESVPLTPGQEILFKILKTFRRHCVADNFASLAGARPSLSDSTRQNAKNWLFLQRNCQYAYAEKPNSWLAQALWNDACASRLRSESELFDFVTESAASERVPGATYQQQLRKGELLGSFAKRLHFILNLQQSSE